MIGPKKPIAGAMLFARWNLTSAARVALPKMVISFPGEPGPAGATINPWAFKNLCNAHTSLLPIPELRFWRNLPEVAELLFDPRASPDVPTPTEYEDELPDRAGCVVSETDAVVNS